MPSSVGFTNPTKVTVMGSQSFVIQYWMILLLASSDVQLNFAADSCQGLNMSLESGPSYEENRVANQGRNSQTQMRH